MKLTLLASPYLLFNPIGHCMLSDFSLSISSSPASLLPQPRGIHHLLPAPSHCLPLASLPFDGIHSATPHPRPVKPSTYSGCTQTTKCCSRKKKSMHVADAIDLRSSSKMDPAMYQQIMIHLDQVYVDLTKTKKSINTNDYINIR